MMRSRASFVLLEQLVMLLVFSICAVICVAVLVQSHEISEKNETLLQGSQIVQHKAELLQGADDAIWQDNGLLAEATNTVLDEDKLCAYYDENWEIATKDIAKYALVIENIPQEIAYLLQKEVRLEDIKKGEILFALPVAKQKEVAYE